VAANGEMIAHETRSFGPCDRFVASTRFEWSRVNGARLRDEMDAKKCVVVVVS
jgi:hypothetical protein